MNTLLFQDMLECQYFIEDLHCRGFTKDTKQSSDTVVTYTNSRLPSYRVVVNVGNMTADLYDSGKLIDFRN